MTITTEEAEALAGQAEAKGIEIYASALRTLAAERDIANEQIYGLSEERERWKDRAEAAEAERDRANEEIALWKEGADRLEAKVAALVDVSKGTKTAIAQLTQRAERAEAERDELRALVPTSHQTSTRWTIERDREGEE